MLRTQVCCTHRSEPSACVSTLGTPISPWIIQMKCQIPILLRGLADETVQTVCSIFQCVLCYLILVQLLIIV
jgi:hypothetical protein